jgi:predicted kinase
LSGTGKSTVAKRLALDVAAAPGAIILRSDVIRKRIFGRTPEERLPPEAYGHDASARAFTTLFKDAAHALGAGSAVILDATFLDGSLRERAAALAAAAGIPFRGLWLEAPDSVLIPRIGARRDDASDATAEVLARQRTAGAGLVGWTRIDASGPPSAVYGRARAVLSQPGRRFVTGP